MFIPSNKKYPKIALTALEPRKHNGQWQLFGEQSIFLFDSTIMEAHHLSDKRVGHVCLLVVPFQFDQSPLLYAASLSEAELPKLGVPELKAGAAEADGSNIVAIARRSDSRSGSTYLTAYLKLDHHEQTMEQLKKAVGEMGTLTVVVEQWQHMDPAAKGVLYTIALYPKDTWPGSSE